MEIWQIKLYLAAAGCSQTTDGRPQVGVRQVCNLNESIYFTGSLQSYFMLGNITVQGDGIAARCCIRLLGQAGLGVTADGSARTKLPAIMLSDGTQTLLQDVFDRTGLFEGLTQVRSRIVAWGKDAKTSVLPHSAVVVSERELLDRIGQPELLESSKHPECQTEWDIIAGRPLGHHVEGHHFGSRFAGVAAVKRKPKSPSGACWIESLDDGWLFLLPADEGAWLLFVGNPVESLLARSRVIADQILDVRPVGGEFACHPRIARSLCAPGWFACGTAALGFDPLCGDGAGHAIREAILACAAVRAIIAGADVGAVLAHYSGRLIAGFRRHLKLCEEFYRSGGQGPWWAEQLAATRRGVEWCESGLSDIAGSRYRLNGFSLEAIE